MPPFPHVLYLRGGVGGARLAHGLADALPADSLTLVVNTGDDFEHWGLRISPDLDTCMYTLAQLSDVERGWGLADESFAALERVKRFGGPDWFALGDRDLAAHLMRTMWLNEGLTLTAVTERLRTGLGVAHPILPMTDAPRPTMIDTSTHGTLSFQDWLVVHRGAPPVDAVRYTGDDSATPQVMAAIESADIVLIAPSNPYVSIDPILTLAGVREAIAAKPVFAMSPIVGGKAVKGPLAEMIPRLAGRAPSAAAIVEHYDGLLTGVVVETGDGDGIDIPVLETSTVMSGRDDRARLAGEVVEWAERVT